MSFSVTCCQLQLVVGAIVLPLVATAVTTAPALPDEDDEEREDTKGLMTATRLWVGGCG